MRDDVSVARDGARRIGCACMEASAGTDGRAAGEAMRRAELLARAGGPLDQDHVALARELLFGEHAPPRRGEGRCPTLPSLGAAIGRDRSTVARKLRDLAALGMAADELWRLRPEAAAGAAGPGRAP